MIWVLPAHELVVAHRITRADDNETIDGGGPECAGLSGTEKTWGGEAAAVCVCALV